MRRKTSGRRLCRAVLLTVLALLCFGGYIRAADYDPARFKIVYLDGLIQPDAQQQKLLNAMPEEYRAVSYQMLKGKSDAPKDGFSYLYQVRRYSEELLYQYRNATGAQVKARYGELYANRTAEQETEFALCRELYYVLDGAISELSAEVETRTVDSRRVTETAVQVMERREIDWKGMSAADYRQTAREFFAYGDNEGKPEKLRRTRAAWADYLAYLYNKDEYSRIEQQTLWTLNADQQALLDATPEALRCVSYGILCSSWGEAWLTRKDNVPVGLLTVYPSDVPLSTLAGNISEFNKAADRSDSYALKGCTDYMLRAYYGRHGAYGSGFVGGSGAAAILSQYENIPNKSAEELRQFKDAEKLTGDMAAVADAWIAYKTRLEDDAYQQRLKDSAAARLQKAMQDGEIKPEVEDDGDYVPAVLKDVTLESKAAQSFLNSLPACYRGEAWLALGLGGTGKEFFTANVRDDLQYIVKEYLDGADKTLAGALPRLSHDYVELSGKRTEEGKLSEGQANRLALLRAMILTAKYESDEVNGRAARVLRVNRLEKALYFEFEDENPFVMDDDALRVAQTRMEARTRDKTDQPQEDYLALITALRSYRAGAPAKTGSWYGLPVRMSDEVERIVSATNPEQRVMAYLLADETLLAKYGYTKDNAYRAWTVQPEELERVLNIQADYFGAPEFSREVLKLWGKGPWHDKKWKSYYDPASARYQGSDGSAIKADYENGDKGWEVWYHAGNVYFTTYVIKENGGNGKPEFVSSRGFYHKPLAYMTVSELYKYRAEMETAYYKADNTAERTAELKSWMELIDAWIALGELRQNKKITSGEEGKIESGGSTGSGGDYNRKTYCLEVSTGRSAGEKVEFFRVVYANASGTHTAYVFPGEDDLAESYRAAAKLGEGGDKVRWIRDNLGYSAGSYENARALRSFHTDQFLFQVGGGMDRVQEIQAFMRHDGAAAEKNSWTCYAMRVYAVNGVKGLDRCGYYSSDFFVDFSGTCVAALGFDGDDPANGVLSGAHDLSWNDYDTLFRFSTDGSGTPRYRLNAGGEQRALSASRDTAIVRLDLADQYMAGLEALATNYTGSRGIASGGNVCEALALRMRYRDSHGAVRETTVPLLTSCAAWLVLEGRQDGRANFVGLAQQGESLAIPMTLPDFARVENIELTLGGTAALTAAGLEATAISASAERDARARRCDAEAIGVTGLSVYRGDEAALSAVNEGGLIRFRVQGTPIQRFISPNEQGVRLEGSGSRYEFTLEDYVQGMRLTPARDIRNQYLVALSTDDVERGGTTANVSVRLTYQDVEGEKKQSNEFWVRDLANEFYGWWPASEPDFGYRYGMSNTLTTPAKGNTVRFLITISDNVERFTGAEVRLQDLNGDEWQMKDLSVYQVSGVGGRTLRWEDVKVSGGESDRVFDRDVQGTLLFSLNNTAAEDPSQPDDPNDPNNPADPGDPVGGGKRPNGPGPILIQDGDKHSFDVEQPKKIEKEDVDWRKLAYNMTFAEAMQDLGFRRTRGSYTVEVQVASDAGNTGGDDDCGSKNQFYFQLLFEGGGKSAIVLANQQLESDGFRSGATEAFTVTTSKEYGKVTAVRVIAEDQASDSDKYDKLKIDSITVKQNSSGQTSPLWRVKNVGWVGIQYRDEGEKTSLSGVTARSMEQVSHVYPVTEDSIAVNVQVSIGTGQLGVVKTTEKDKNGKESEVSTPVQFQGELSGRIYYTVNGGGITYRDIPDIVELMYQFNNRAVRYTQHTRADGSAYNGLAASDPTIMFRENRTDRFELALDGLSEVLSLELYARSSVRTTWNITDVSVSLIRGKGERTLNVGGEYFMQYAEGEELQTVAWCSSTSSPKYSRDLPATGGNSAPATVIPISFSSKKVDVSFDFSDVRSQVSEVPAGGNETLNVVLYPTAATLREMSYQDLQFTAQYSVDGSDRLVQAAVPALNRGGEGEEQAWYYEGLNIAGANSLRSLAVKSSAAGRAALRGGFAQVLRGGVAVATYELGAAANLEMGAPVPIDSPTGETQRVTFQLGADMTETRLVSEKTDLAVSFTYLSEGPIQREYQSRRVLLSKSGYGTLSPGQTVTVDFAQGHVREITGVTVIPVGELSAPVEGAYAQEITGTGAVTGRWSFPGGTAGGVSTLHALPTAGGVQPLTVEIHTASDGSGGGAGQAVAMTLGYYAEDGGLAQKTWNDVRPFITGDNKLFQAGETATLRILVSGMRELRWVELQPAASGAGVAWKLDHIALRLGDDGLKVERDVSAPLPFGETGHYALADIHMNAKVALPVVTPAQAEGEEDKTSASALQSTTVTNGSLDVTLKSGQSLRFQPYVTGSIDSFDVVLKGLYRNGGATGDPVMEDTRGYTQAYIDGKIAAATAAGNSEEAAVWRGVKPSSGTLTAGSTFTVSVPAVGDEPAKTETLSGYTFTPPRNFIIDGVGTVLSYQIQITSREDPEVRVLLNIDVQPERNPVTDQLEDLYRRQEAQRQKELEERLRAVEENQNQVSISGGEAAGE